MEATNVLTHCHLALPPLWFKGIWREEFLLSAIHSHPSTLLPAGSRSVGRSYIRVKNAGRTRSFGVNVANVVYTLYIFEFEHIYIIYLVQYRPVMCIRDPAKKKMSCTSVPPIPSLKWLKQTDTIGMLCRIFQHSLTFQAMRQHVLAAQHDLHWSADHRGRPVFWLIPCSSLFKDVRSNLGTRSSCKKQSPTDLPVWNSERIIPTRCKRCAHFAPCILLLHDPTKGSSTKQSEKETHSSENWTGFLRFQRFQMGHEVISTEYAYIILHLSYSPSFLIRNKLLVYMFSQHSGSLSR